MRKRIPALVAVIWTMIFVGVRAQPVIVAGYNAGLKPGLNLVGLHLDYGNDHSISNILREMVEGAELYKVMDGNFTTNIYKAAEWERPNDTMALGEGVYIFNPTAETHVHGFGGNVPQGFLTNSIPAGLSIRASMAPKGGKLTQDLGLRLSAFDNVYLLEEGALKVFTYLPNGTWRPFEPVVRLSGAFLINAAQATNWVMEFEI